MRAPAFQRSINGASACPMSASTYLCLMVATVPMRGSINTRFLCKPGLGYLSLRGEAICPHKRRHQTQQTPMPTRAGVPVTQGRSHLSLQEMAPTTTDTYANQGRGTCDSEKEASIRGINLLIDQCLPVVHIKREPNLLGHLYTAHRHKALKS